MPLPIEHQNLNARRALEVEMRPIRPGRNKPWLRFLREREYFVVRSRRPGQALRFSDEITRGSGKCVKLSLGHFLAQILSSACVVVLAIRLMMTS